MPAQEISIKELLHKAIDESEDEKLLEAVYTILSSNKKDIDISIEVTDEQWMMLKEREEKYLSGSEQAYSFEDFKKKFSDEHGI
jgi:hypothetical protein